MSVKIMGAVWDADLPRDEKIVLLSYADHAAHDGTSIYPSVGHTAWKTGYTKRSVQIITKKLVARHILILDGKGWRGTNRYRLDITALPQREEYQWGEEFSPRKKQQEGVKKTTEGGEEFSPYPSSIRQESSHGEDAALASPNDNPAVEDTALEDIMGPRQHFIPKGEVIQSSGDWAAHLQNSPHLTWGSESQEIQRQVERYGSGAEPILRLGYELGQALGLRPVWSNRQKVKTWVSGLVSCLEEAEGDWQLVVNTGRQMREEGLEINSPHSIAGMAGGAAAKKRSKATEYQRAQQRMAEDPQYQTFKRLREAKEREQRFQST